MRVIGHQATSDYFARLSYQFDGVTSLKFTHNAGHPSGQER